MPLASRALAALQMLRDFAYDENSNPVSTTDAARARNNSAKHPFDVVYGLDSLNRVIAADEGNIASGDIESGTRTRRELWNSLSLTGNWGNRQLDSNGDGDFGDEADRDEPSAYNTFNKANEWTARRVAKASGSDRDEHAYTYDAVGNLTDLALTVYRGANSALTHRRLVYDAFGRLVRVAAVEGMDETDVALYRYNGLNMRLMWQDDADADSSLESSERFYVMFDERWRPVATFRDTDSTPKEAFVWHAAGGAGLGGSSYIDSIILRDRDNSTGGTPNPMTSASDGTLEERRYSCQNWRADVVAVTKSDGTPIEYVRYSAYGEPTVYPVADLNMDGVVNSTDSALWSDLLYSTSNASVYANTDLDWDGLDDWNSGGADGDLFYESYTANLGLNGAGRASSPGVGNRVGYAGYQYDGTINAYHVRYRVYLPEIGRWTRRDPLGYVDGQSLYEYVGSQAVAGVDPLGLFWPEDSPLKRFPKPLSKPSTEVPAYGHLDCMADCMSYLGTDLVGAMVLPIGGGFHLFPFLETLDPTYIWPEWRKVRPYPGAGQYQSNWGRYLQAKRIVGPRRLFFRRFARGNQWVIIAAGAYDIGAVLLCHVACNERSDSAEHFRPELLFPPRSDRCAPSGPSQSVPNTRPGGWRPFNPMGG